LTSTSVKFQILVIDYKLTYPSGTATAVLINGFHAPQGDDVAKYVVQHNPLPAEIKNID
jgi:uncharacterized oligopeptide transporter (OPT) family protein